MKNEKELVVRRAVSLVNEAGRAYEAKDSTRDAVSLGHAGITSSVGIPSYWERGAVTVVEDATMSGAHRELCSLTSLTS
jgi:hypothetical protein